MAAFSLESTIFKCYVCLYFSKCMCFLYICAAGYLCQGKGIFIRCNFFFTKFSLFYFIYLFIYLYIYIYLFIYFFLFIFFKIYFIYLFFIFLFIFLHLFVAYIESTTRLTSILATTPNDFIRK